MSEPRTVAGQFLQAGLEAMGFAAADAAERIVAIEIEAAALSGEADDTMLMAGDPFVTGEITSPDDWACVDCGIPLEPGSPPICEECVDD